MRHSILILTLAACVIAVTSRPSSAQTLLTYDGAGAAVVEITGPPAGCGYPAGPVVGGFPTFVPFPCPTAGPVFPPAPAGIAGGMATDRFTDTVYVSDGFVITAYTAAGAPITSWFPALGFVTGLAFDSGTGTLFHTDGVMIVGEIPPPAPGCAGAPIVVPPWPAAPAVFGPMTGLSWDPTTLTLWGVDVGGMVYTIPIGGPGFPVYPSVPDPTGCGLGFFGPVQGIAYDRSTPGAANPPAFFITDGAIISHQVLGGAPAIPTLPHPFPCIPVPAGPISGIAYTSRTVTIGVGTDPTGLPLPKLTSTGQWTSPSGPLTIVLAGADPAAGTLAGLMYNFAPPFGFGVACPAIPAFGGNALYLVPPLFGPIGPFPTAAGMLTLPAALPPGLPLGLQMNFQWIIAKGSGGFQASNAIAATIALP